MGNLSSSIDGLPEDLKQDLLLVMNYYKNLTKTRKDLVENLVFDPLKAIEVEVSDMKLCGVLYGIVVIKKGDFKYFISTKNGIPFIYMISDNSGIRRKLNNKNRVSYSYSQRNTSSGMVLNFDNI